jgi:hypothetical protein
MSLIPAHIIVDSLMGNFLLLNTECRYSALEYFDMGFFLREDGKGV